MTDYADLVRRLSDAGASVEAIWIAVQAVQAASEPRTYHSESWGTKAGPLARYGYAGPITPRLPDEEWWPLRNAVIERDGWRCAYCEDASERFTADHVIPLSRGGSNDPENLVCCCLPCNSSKRDQLLSEWTGRQTTRLVRDFSHITGRMHEHA